MKKNYYKKLIDILQILLAENNNILRLFTNCVNHGYQNTKHVGKQNITICLDKTNEKLLITSTFPREKEKKIN